MTDHFDKWINGMTEEQYEDWLEDDASRAQEEKALNIRTPLSEQEEEDIEAEQAFEPVSARRELDMPVISQPPRIITTSPQATTGEQVKIVIIPPAGKAPELPRPILIMPSDIPIRQKQSFFARIKSFFRGRK